MSSARHPNSADASSVGSSYVTPDRLNVSLADSYEGESAEKFETIKIYKSEDYFLPRSLDIDTAVAGLKDVGKITTGESYAYLTLNASRKHLIEISVILRYPHLKNVDLSCNLLHDEAVKCLEKLTQLQRLNLSANNITKVTFFRMPSLAWLNLSSNKLTSLKNIYQPELETLIVSNNHIDEILFTKRYLPNLKVLDVSRNYLKVLYGINLPSLTTLYIDYNYIQAIDKSCVSLLENLKELHLRENYIGDLDEFEDCCKNLEYLNLRSNRVGTLAVFIKFREHENMRTLILSENPIMINRNIIEDEVPTEAVGGEEDEDNPVLQFRAEVLALFPNLERLNKHYLTNEEKLYAMLEAEKNLMEIFKQEIQLHITQYSSGSDIGGQLMSPASSYEEDG